MSALAKKIDKGLAEYYKSMGRDDYNKNKDGMGKFEFYCKDNGFDEDDTIQDELDQADPADCSLIEFDGDEDDDTVNHFPFAHKIDDSAEVAKEIQRILNDIAKYGRVKQAVVAMKLSTTMCEDLSSEEQKRSNKIYTAALGNLDKNADKDLKYYLAVGIKHGFPFLTYFVDAFTKEKAARHYEAKQKKKKVPDLTVTTWTKKNIFFQALRRKNAQKDQQFVSAMVSYSNRIMTRLQLTPSYKIEDSLQQIVEYLVSIPLFIKNLIDKSAAIPPFQVDLLIAVKKVIATFPDGGDNLAEEDDGGYSSEDQKENEDTDPSIDHIGSLQEGLDQLSLCHTPIAADANNGGGKMEERVEAIQRQIGEKYGEFRTILSEKKAKDFDAKTYPHCRRFSIFIDRRPKSDVLAIFEPPRECNKMETNSVAEIGFELLSKCVVPRGDGKHTTAKDRCCGQLATFMFNVAAKDEMRCYIVWNGQTMRFQGDHIVQILPNLFVDKAYDNDKFVAGKEPTTMGQKFDNYMEDRRFTAFLNALQNFDAKK